MNTKLIINLKDGILEADGSEDFVRSVYDDFKGEVAKRLPSGGPRQIESPPPIPANHIDNTFNPPAAKTKRVRVKRTASLGDGQKVANTKYKPAFDSTLDLKELVAFYDTLAPTTARERILTFAVFLRDKLKLEPCTADQIYTCFFTVKDRAKMPEAFVQAFHDTQSKTHWIDFKSLQTITVTIPGDNKIEEMKKKRKAAA